MARFIKEGLQVNDTVIIVATAQHCEELRKALTPEQVTHDKLMFLDAGEQLWKFMVNDLVERITVQECGGRYDGSGSSEWSSPHFGEMVAVPGPKGTPASPFVWKNSGTS